MDTVKRGALILSIAAARAGAQNAVPAEGACDGKIVTSIAITPRDPSFLAVPRQLRGLARAVGLLSTTSTSRNGRPTSCSSRLVSRVPSNGVRSRNASCACNPFLPTQACVSCRTPGPACASPSRRSTSSRRCSTCACETRARRCPLRQQQRRRSRTIPGGDCRTRLGLSYWLRRVRRGEPGARATLRARPRGEACAGRRRADRCVRTQVLHRFAANRVAHGPERHQPLCVLPCSRRRRTFARGAASVLGHRRRTPRRARASSRVYRHARHA